jgi:3-hydroxyacyl-[acyl-carrier-protein] dehydratase
MIMSPPKSEGCALDIGEIMATIQHRYPFLLVDRVLTLEPGVRAVGLKNITAGEHFFQGQYPGNPLLPGVLTVEHAAQVGYILLLATLGGEGKLALFAGIENLHFRRRVRPGDQVITEVTVRRISGRAGKAYAISRVEGEVAVEGLYTFVLVPDPVQRPGGSQGI